MFTVGVFSVHQSPGLIYTFTALQVKGVESLRGLLLSLLLLLLLSLLHYTL